MLLSSSVLSTLLLAHSAIAALIPAQPGQGILSNAWELLQEPVNGDIQAFSLHKKNEHLLWLHKSLMEIESISGNEESVGEWLVKYLKKQNFSVETQEVADEDSVISQSKGKKQKRFNILAWMGKERQSRVLVSSHIDTVPPFWPYETKKVNGTTEIWGRGSVDDKGPLAAQVTAVLSLRASSTISPGDISFLFVVGEETGGDGMRAANSLPGNLTWETVVFGEPTEGKLASGHKGNLGLQLRVRGKAAHSGYPWLGVSANEVLVKALGALLALEPKLPSSEKYGKTTMNIGKVDGGVAANVVAETASANIAFRLADGTPAEVRKQVLDSLQDLEAETVKAGGELIVHFTSEGYGPVAIDHDIPGFDSITVNYGTDIPNLDGDHKRYLYGPGSILVAHSDHEHLTVDDLEKAVDDYETIIKHALGK